MSDNRVSDFFQSILAPYFISQDNICISGEGTSFQWNCNSLQNFLHAKSHKDQNQVRGYINDLCTIITQYLHIVHKCVGLKTQFLSRDIINNDKTERKMKKKPHYIQKYGNYISMTDSQKRACVP